jgi:tripeptidyl-peptidase I
MIGMLGLRGITILHSAGDTGAGAGCLTNDGTNRTILNAQFPPTCPYVTSVGGTQAFKPEVAWVDGSGGFSGYFPQAFYQKPAVDTYLSTGISAESKVFYSRYTNFSGRAFPDVSAHSTKPEYAVFYKGQLTQSGGTSAAVPVFAALVAMLNDARLKANKPALGFINPWLYSGAADALNDITGGYSVGCNGFNGQTGLPVKPPTGIVPGGGARWNATKGWDPVTGLGTPDFVKLLDAAMKI